ncbi:MAG: NupC/NupG family nucleoside CNT transporter [Chloroflexi bacterium]|nr:NupC/NupG family nucleoside CNT transporter [Chloroflexota bacterium]
MLNRLPAILGMLVIILIAYLLSVNKKAINKKTFFMGLSLQIIFAVFVLKGQDMSIYLHKIIELPSLNCGGFDLMSSGMVLIMGFVFYFTYKNMKRDSSRTGVLSIEGLIFIFFMLYGNLLEKFFNLARIGISKIIDCTIEGSKFVFGPLALNKEPWGVVFAFQVLPTIIFVASIFAILYYLGVMQKVVGFLARVMSRFMGTSGAESTGVAANIFMGQTEAPLTIRPYLEGLTMSELMVLMTSGMAHVSGGIMTAYVMIAGVDIKHLLTAVIMTAPGSIMLAKMMIPETDSPRTGKDMKVEVPVTDVNIIDAAARGASEGGLLALNVAGMLIAFVALVTLINGGFSLAHSFLSTVPSAGDFFSKFFPGSMEQLMGWIFAPLAWLMGVSWHDAPTVGSLMGTRMILNEFVAFMKLGEIQAGLDPRSFIIATYALCGFANLASIAIQIGGIGSLAPSRRHDIAKLGLRAMLGGTLANFLTATIAGILL